MYWTCMVFWSSTPQTPKTSCNFRQERVLRVMDEDTLKDSLSYVNVAHENNNHLHDVELVHNEYYRVVFSAPVNFLTASGRRLLQCK